MQLLTKAQKEKMIKNHFAQINSDGTKDFKAVVKLFNPTGNGTWYLSELDPESNTAYGLCDLGTPEMGYVSLDELSNIKVSMGLGIERDRWFKPMEFERIINARAFM
jgi:hypothetical protein